MKFHSLVLDSVLPDPWSLRDHAVAARYADEKGPTGAVYPTICRDVPDSAAAEVQGVLEMLFGQVDVKLSLFRLTTADRMAPYYAHTDRFAGGEYTGLLYLNRPENCHGGTSLLRHVVTGLDRTPETPDEAETWERDANIAARWLEVGYVPMRFNRLFVLPSNAMHAASPGFGRGPADGRLVLITFFSPRR